MPRSILLSRLLPVLAALFALLVGAPALAQTAGDLKVSVIASDDQSGIPGVTCQLSGATLIGGTQSKDSDDDGNIHYIELPPGVYKLQCSKGGWKGVTLDGIQINVGRTTQETVTLESGSDQEVVTVEAKQKTVDVENTTRGEVLTKDFLSKIPTGRTYQSAVQQVAGVVGGGGGNPNMGGGAYNENTYMLDGVNITDPVTGTFSLNFNYDAIQQVEVLLGGYEPEYGISLGGVVNLVTESGTNNLQFDSSVYYENGNWAPRMDARYSSDGFQVAPTGFDSSFQAVQITAKISGPVVRDRAWFIFSYEGDRTLISNTGIKLPRDYDGHYVLAKLTVQPNSEHRITTFLQLNPTTVDNETQSSVNVRPEAQSRQSQGGYVAQLRWQWFLSPNANLDTQIVSQKEYLEGSSVPCTHNRKLGYNPCQPDEAEGTIDWTTPGRFGVGGAYDSVNYYYFDLDDRYRYDVSTKLAVLSVKDPLGGTHDLKFGAEGVQTIWDRLVGYNGNMYFVDINQTSYDPQSFTNYYWIESTGPVKFRTSGSQWNWFAQDAYKPISNLTIKYGVRYDHTVMRNDVGDPVITAGLWGPRAYAAWDPFGDQKTKIAGGYGRFNDTSNLSVAQFTDVGSYGYKLYLGELFKSGDQGFLNGPSLMYDISPRTNPNISLDNLRTPRVDEFLIMLQRQLIEDVSIGSTVSTKMTRYLYEPDEINLIYDEDGSAVIGARNGDQLTSIERLRTPQIAKRDYVQADFYLDKVNSRRWFGRLTYSYVQSIGNSRYSLSGTFLNDPQTQYNYGNLYETDIRHQVKGYAAWSLPTDPWVQTIGASLQYLSGTPFEREYWNDEYQSFGLRIRPRGVYGRLPGWWTASIKFSQDLDVKKGKLILDVEASNIFNFQAPQDVDWYYVDKEDRLFALYRQDPFRLQLGLRYEF